MQSKLNDADKQLQLTLSIPKSDLIDFTLSNARQFYLSKGDPLGVKGLDTRYIK